MVLDMNDNEIQRMDEFKYFKEVVTDLNQMNSEFFKSQLSLLSLEQRTFFEKIL